MAIYDKNGNVLLSAYDVNADILSSAYDIDGNIIHSSEPPAPNFKVMSYNVGHWYTGGASIVPSAKDADYYALQNGMIQNADADLLCICEYRNMFSESGRTALSLLSQYYPYIKTVNGDYNYTGKAICSKYPLTDLHIITQQYWYSNMTFNGETIPVIIVHLSANDSRTEQLANLVTYLRGKQKFIACGDYNTLSITGSVTTEASDYTNMIVPLLNANFNLANCSDNGFLVTYSDEPTGTYTGCLDNIVTSSNITIIDAYVDETKLTDSIVDKTDHMPLIAELHIN